MVYLQIIETISRSKMTLIIYWPSKLHLVRIFFDSPAFDRITKDRAAKFVDYVSAIEGTMGLLTGFSIISAVEIVYFVVKFIFSALKLKKW